MIKQKTGKRIRALRTAQGYSQERFARLCGLDRTYFASVEQGKRNVSIENLEKISTGLGISLAELFAFDLPVHRNIVLHIGHEVFILETDQELTPEIADNLEFACRSAFDEDSSEFTALLPDSDSSSLMDMSAYDIATLVPKYMELHFGIKARFRACDVEVTISIS